MVDNKRNSVMPDLIKLNEILFNDINELRKNPFKYYKKLEANLKNIKNNHIIMNGVKIKINDIKNSLSLMEILRKTQPLSSLSQFQGLSSSSNFLVNLCMTKDDDKIMNYLDKISKDDMLDIVIKYCKPIGILGMSFDICDALPEAILFNLLQDDKLYVKKNRDLLLNKDLKYIGISSAYLPSLNKTLVIILYTQDLLLSEESFLSSPISEAEINKKQSYNMLRSTRRSMDLVNDRLSLNKDSIKYSLNNFKQGIKHYSVDKELFSPKAKSIKANHSIYDAVNILSPKSKHEYLVDHLYNSEKQIESIKVEKKILTDKYKREGLYMIKKILYTSGEYEEIANKI